LTFNLSLSPPSAVEIGYPVKMNGAELPCGTVLLAEPATSTTSADCTTTVATHLPSPQGPELVVDAAATKEMEVARVVSSTKDDVGPSVMTNADAYDDSKDDDNDDLDDFFDSL
jgi:hypothetical protein